MMSVSVFAVSSESEPNNTMATADVFTVNSTVTATISSSTDVDYFKFTPTENGVYKFYTTGNLDTFGTLYQESNILLEDDDGGTNYNFMIACYMKKNTAYYIKVRGLTSSSTGSYTFYIQTTTTYTDFNWDYMYNTPYMADTVTNTYSTAHKGVDIVDYSGGVNVCDDYPMYAVADGTVISILRTASTGNMACIVLDCGLTVRYLHMDEPAYVSLNSRVYARNLIGYTGSLGDTSTGPHLHFDINNLGE